MSKIDTYKQIVEGWLKYPKTLKEACAYWRKAIKG